MHERVNICNWGEGSPGNWTHTPLQFIRNLVAPKWHISLYIYKVCATRIDWTPYALNHSMGVFNAVMLKIGAYINVHFRDWVIPGIHCPFAIQGRLSGTSPGLGARRLHWDRNVIVNGTYICLAPWRTKSVLRLPFLMTGS